MACFLGIASIGPQRASGSLGPVSGPKLTSRLRPCLLDQAGFLFAGDRGRARPCTPQLRRLILYPVELRGQPRELQRLISIVMAKLEPLLSKTAMSAIVASMSLLVGLVAAAVATD